jgi:hypothetical protein
MKPTEEVRNHTTEEIESRTTIIGEVKQAVNKLNIIDP